MTQAADQKPLALSIALDTLRHLGINLYSSLPPVLSEFVASAYDARARRVDITLNSDEVIIEDDGIGMTRADVQEKYLVVVRGRRLHDPPPTSEEHPFKEWPLRNKPIGRKGIGKLAMFSIANEVELATVRAGTSVAMRMQREHIEDAARTSRPYNPAEPKPEGSRTKGTRIVLRRQRRKNAPSADLVLRALARRFSVIDLNSSGGAADQSACARDPAATGLARLAQDAHSHAAMLCFGERVAEYARGARDVDGAPRIAAGAPDLGGRPQSDGWGRTLGDASLAPTYS